ncbi:MAG TPA: glycoside hydrolase family 2 TIM barrel-domain containing protein [Bacteroidota bacterium]|nr:glycoside hydrolase family 2 TIM barrel-domain containing protein [Bacteroidota bacterium]
MFPDSPSRTKLDLSGEWKYSLDGKEWNSVTLPAVYDIPAKVTFQRTFEIKSEMLDKYAFSLVFYGINYQSEITINGNFVGRHQGGYTSVVIPIQPNTLQVGSENTISIGVDNELTTRTTLPLRQEVGGWRSYGGISRDIYLLATPKLYIERADVQTSVEKDSTSGYLTVAAEVIDKWSGIKSSDGSALGYQVEVYDKLKGEFITRSEITPLTPEINKSVRVSADVTIPAPKLWSPEQPDLYVIKCQIVQTTAQQKQKSVALKPTAPKTAIVIDEYSLDVGLRTIAWTNGKLLINNAVTPIKGLVWYEDHPSFGSAMTYEAMERDVAQIKSIGANLIRFPYPPHPYLLNLCDRYGILAMEEIPLVGVPSEILLRDYYQELTSNTLREMVQRDKNHASVIAWGIGDKFESFAPSAGEYVGTAKNLIKSLDGRPVYYSTSTTHDASLAALDIIGFDAGQSEIRDVKQSLNRLRTSYPAKPIIITAYGRSVEPGDRKGYSDPRSLEAQARYFMRFYDGAKDEKIAGSVIMAFSDWRTDRPALTTNSSDAFVQTLGILGYERDKRVSFDVVRALFNGEKIQALPVGNYSPGVPIIYVVSGLTILVSLAFFYNTNRRFRDNVMRSMIRTYNFFADVRDQRILTYMQSSFLLIVIALTWSTILSSILSHYRYDLLLDNILSQFLTDGIKNSVVHLIWSPIKFIGVFSLLIVIKVVVITLLVMLFSALVRSAVYFYHAFSIVVWSMLPFIILIPMAMILYRLMETDAYIIPVFVILGVMIVWVAIRLLKGISIIYDTQPARVYTGGVLLLLILVVVAYGYLDYTQSTSIYMKFLLHSMARS